MKYNKNLLCAVGGMFVRQKFPWDEYFPTMAEADFKDGRGYAEATKSFFIRSAPFGGSHALLGGLTEALLTISTLRLDDEEFQAGMKEDGYSDEFLAYLADMKNIKISIYSPPEGSVFFPSEPVLTMSGPLPLIRLAEGIITEACNFPTLSLTKWHRLVRTVRGSGVLEFARRRAQTHMRTSLYARLAGCAASSNREIKRFIDIDIKGTMGHEWVQGYGDVRDAFQAWLRSKPGKAIGLIDTIQCLEHDFPIWLDCVLEFKDEVKASDSAIWGWRNDSGDLAYLTIEQYVMFMAHPLAEDPWFKKRMRIVLTNDLDEYAAAEIISEISVQAQAAGLDVQDILGRIIWAAGTKPGTCSDQPSIGGVAKLMEIDGLECIKLAMDELGKPGIKTSLPGDNRSAWIRDAKGKFVCVLVYPAKSMTINREGKFISKEGGFMPKVIAMDPNDKSKRIVISNYTAIPRQILIYDGKTGLMHHLGQPSLDDVTKRIWSEMDSLHWTVTRIDKPRSVKVYVTPGIFGLRQKMISQKVLRVDKLCD